MTINECSFCIVFLSPIASPAAPRRRNRSGGFLLSPPHTTLPLPFLGYARRRPVHSLLPFSSTPFLPDFTSDRTLSHRLSPRHHPPSSRPFSPFIAQRTTSAGASRGGDRCATTLSRTVAREMPTHCTRSAGRPPHRPLVDRYDAKTRAARSTAHGSSRRYPPFAAHPHHFAEYGTQSR